MNSYQRRARARRWDGWILLLLGGVLSASLFAQDERGVVTLLAVPNAERERVGFDAGTSTALFVGVRNFDDDALTSVPFAVDDAVDLAYLFAFELALVTPRRVVLALSGEPAKDDSKARLAELKKKRARVVPATKSKILRHLLRQSKAAGADGLFLVGLATHGFNKAGQDFLFARDTELAYPKETGIPVPLVFEMLADARTPRRFALLDACKERLGAARGTGQASPMGRAFHDAIAAAQGQVVLAATTTHGYAYDDVERRNGVFTAAVLDGLRGEALSSNAPFVTAGSLAAFVNGQVLAWVAENRPTDHQSRGITSSIEGAGASLPLAADANLLKRSLDYQARRDAAIDKLRDNLGGPLKGETFDTVVAFLNVETPTDAHLELLLEMEALDGTRRAKRGLAAYVEKYVGPSVHGAAPAPTPELERAVQMAKLTVRSNVRGDTVYIDGAARGPTGPKAHELAPGTYTVRVEKPGYEPWEGPVVLAAGERETLRAELVWVPRPKVPVTDPGIDEATKDTGRQAGESWTEPTTGMEFVWVPKGCFQMGSEDGEANEKPVHRVCVEGFWLGKYEVTQGQWQLVMGSNPANFKKGDDYPIDSVSWDDTQEFIRKLNGKGQRGLRLPSEGEWEYACRSGGRAETYCGGEYVDSLGWYDGIEGGIRGSISYGFEKTTHPVGRKEANRLGLHDMSGNVWEWVQDCWHEYYHGAPGDGSAWADPRCSLRVNRGGARSSSASEVRAAYRNWSGSSDRNDSLGFRLAKTP